MYAIVEACGRQYKVAEGDLVFVEKLLWRIRDGFSILIYFR